MRASMKEGFMDAASVYKGHGIFFLSECFIPWIKISFKRQLGWIMLQPQCPVIESLSVDGD